MTNQTPRVFTGSLELNESGPGYLRDAKRNYAADQANPQVPRELIEKFGLRGGESITAAWSMGKRGRGRRLVKTIETIFGKPAEENSQAVSFDDLSVVHPVEQLKFETTDGPMTMRVVDLFAPIGKGQRALLVAPPRTGKTILLQHMAEGIKANHPEALLMMLLVDERPEEVTEMRRAVCRDGSGWDEGYPEVVYSSNDCEPKNHARISKLSIARAKRYVEMGKDVVILLDSLTRLSRAFNTIIGSSGRTMTGGLDIRALGIPKTIFGAARKIESGGSLTIIASVLIETGSRMDDFIFQEFKGTGNMELVLSRELANLRTWPAADLSASGTRKEEMLLGQDAYDKISRVRRRLLSMKPVRQMETILSEFKKFPTNQAYLKNLAS